jgi:hypothetical protein
MRPAARASSTGASMFTSHPSNPKARARAARREASVTAPDDRRTSSSPAFPLSSAYAAMRRSFAASPSAHSVMRVPRTRTPLRCAAAVHPGGGRETRAWEK